MLRLHDTATGTVRPLELRDPGHVSMYVCGPTVYDLPHLGHGRYALVFDVLRRHLLFSGLDVRYVSNITDVDDNIIKRAAEQGRSESEVAVEYEAEWWAAMDALGNLRPTDTPHATAYVADMVTLVAALVERQVAYETSDGVYLSVDRVPGYGLLALQPLDSLRAGARVEAVEEKRSPLDFALWKKAKAGEPSWPSPWGPGRPGWHTECVVMSLDLLGDGFDLHGGGRDLAFPHHENERAQAVALGRPFARHWAHNGWVEVGGRRCPSRSGTSPRSPTCSSAATPGPTACWSCAPTTARPSRSPPRRSPTPRRASSASTPWPGDSRSPTSWPRRAGRWWPASARQPRPTRRRWANCSSAWTTTSTPPAPWPASSSWSAGPTRRPTPATPPAPPGRPARWPWPAPPSGSPCGAGRRRSTPARPAWPPSATRPGPGRDWARADALRDELVARGWTVEDGPEGTVLRH